MTKEKRNSEPELKLWDSPVTTKKYTKNRKTGQLDLLWGEERPLFDDWDNRMEQKTARARIARATATWRYAVHPLRSTNRPSAVVLLYNMKLLPGAALYRLLRTGKGAAVVEPACRKNCKALRFILLRCCF